MPTAHASQRRSAQVTHEPAGGLEIKVRAFELKTLGADDPGAPASFSGHGACFHNIDSAGDIIAPGAFAEDLADFLREGHIGGLNHNWDDPIARPVVAYEDEKGLYVETGDIVDTAHGTDVSKLLRKGIIRKLSIGFRVVREQRIASMAAIEDYWKSHRYTPSDEDISRATQAIKVGGLAIDDDGDVRNVKGVRMLRRIKLYEISPVTVPANMLADVTGVKASDVNVPVPGTSFDSRARRVVQAAGEFVERVEGRTQARFKAGRVLSQANFDSIVSVADAMDASCARLRGILDLAASKRADEPAADAAKSGGPPPAADDAARPATPAVPHVPAPADPGPPPASPPAPAIDEADILAQYALTQYAITMAAVRS